MSPVPAEIMHMHQMQAAAAAAAQEEELVTAFVLLLTGSSAVPLAVTPGPRVDERRS